MVFFAFVAFVAFVFVAFVFFAFFSVVFGASCVAGASCANTGIASENATAKVNSSTMSFFMLGLDLLMNFLLFYSRIPFSGLSVQNCTPFDSFILGIQT